MYGSSFVVMDNQSGNGMPQDAIGLALSYTFL